MKYEIRAELLEQIIEKLKGIILIYHTIPIHDSVSAKTLQELNKLNLDLESELSVLESSTDGREKDKICNDKCKWFKIGYGHCNFCIRQVKEHDCKDNFESSEPEKPKDKVMAEEIYNDQAEFNKWLRENTDYEKEHIISMMEEYAQQFKSKEVTDEEISKKLDLIDFKTSRERETAFELCVWMRDGKIK